MMANPQPVRLTSRRQCHDFARHATSWRIFATRDRETGMAEPVGGLGSLGVGRLPLKPRGQDDCSDNPRSSCGCDGRRAERNKIAAMSFDLAPAAICGKLFGDYRA